MAPILLVVDSNYGNNPFGRYLGQILKTEGFVAHDQIELSQIDLELLRGFSLVILAEAVLDTNQSEVLRQYVSGGGRLIAMRPDPRLVRLFGLAHEGLREETVQQYLGVDSESPIARGIEGTSLQYHGPADVYRLEGASPVAWLYKGEAEPSPHPAVAVHRYGEGIATAFTYDLARSVALTRQGNPGWACGPDRCEDGDGREGIRPVDAFLRQSGETWVNPVKIPIPQADEQQRLLSNCIMALSEGGLPLPRLWYLPKGKGAALVMTGDGDDVGFHAFEPVLRTVEEYGGHFSAYLHLLEGDPSAAQVDDWIERGHEVSVHVDDTVEAARPTLEGMRSAYSRGAGRFRDLYGREPGPSVRHHWLIWYGWVDAAEVAHSHGTRLDFNYYHGPQWSLPDRRWVNGYFTGSGLPQRLVKGNGALLDVFQLLTEWADETQLWKQELGVDGATRVVREMFDAAEERYPTFFVANFHPGGWLRRQTEPWGRNMMEEATRRGIPIWSGRDLYDFLTARDQALFTGISWDGNRLRFTFEGGQPLGLLTVMLPAVFNTRPLKGVTRDGTDIEPSIRRVAGREYAFLETIAGSHEFIATYGL